MKPPKCFGLFYNELDDCITCPFNEECWKINRPKDWGKLILPCGKVADCPKAWKGIIPFYGCHDYCPNDEIELWDSQTCELFLLEYYEELDYNVDGKYSKH